jgi:hypothetical protein
MKRYADIIKTSRDSSDRGDKHINPKNFAVLMRFKNVSTDISAGRDSGDSKTLSSPASSFVLKQETNKPAKNLMFYLSLAVFITKMKSIFEEPID